jgi:hypothetical protein
MTCARAPSVFVGLTTAQKIKYLESLEQGAGMFDQSMLDCVFDSLEFGWPTITQDPIQWYAIQ